VVFKICHLIWIMTLRSSIVVGYNRCVETFCLLLVSCNGFNARYLRNVDIHLPDYKVVS